MHMIKKDLSFMRKILPAHYTVKESKTAGSIHCVSRTGIRKGIDGEDEERWDAIFTAIKGKFGSRFQEVYHNTCSNHVDFTVYLKKQA